MASTNRGVSLAPSRSRILTYPEVSPQNDRFSSLPVELLDTIFGLAWPEGTELVVKDGIHYAEALLNPLSRHLLGFTQKRLYSHIYLNNHHQLDQLYRTLDSRPDLARCARYMTIKFSSNTWGAHSTIARKIRKILGLLPGLQRFSQNGWMKELAVYELMKVPLPNLTKISVSVVGDYIDLDDLHWISQLPNLDTMELNGWGDFRDVVNPGSTTFGVKSLSVRGCGPDSEAFSVLVESCPRLVNVRLQTEYQIPGVFEELLPCLPATLESLSLQNQTRGEDGDPIDPDLVRFSQLRHLELNGQKYSARIYRALSTLTKLRSFTLSGHRMNLNGILALVEGPRRLPHLESITFGRYKVPDYLSGSSEDEGDERTFLYNRREFDEVGSEEDHGNDSTDIQDTDWFTGTLPLSHPSQLGSNFVPSPYPIVLLPMPAPFLYQSPPLTLSPAPSSENQVQHSTSSGPLAQFEYRLPLPNDRQDHSVE
ncbi:hypothetical protein JCM5350_007652 [Sporobolomyces pararoseus]